MADRQRIEAMAPAGYWLDLMRDDQVQSKSLPRVVLAGGGHAHLAVLDDWTRAPLCGVETWLVTAAPFTAYSGMIPGWMAGHYRAGQHLIDLRPLAKRAGVKLVIDTVEGLDAKQRKLTLSSGESVSFDLLSLAVGGEVDTSPLASLGDQLLPVRPMNAFVARWPLVLKNAARRQDFRLFVVGGGAAGIEIALAAEYALRHISANPRVTIVTAENGLLSGHSDAAIACVRTELARRDIDLIFADAAGSKDAVLLSTGKTIDADYVIAATGSSAPRWLKATGLALDQQGFIEVGADLRSISHDNIFAAGDIVKRTDRRVARSGVHAVHAGPVLAANLRAQLNRQKLDHYIPRRRTLYLLATGERRAILSWGAFTMSGSLVWQLKDWIDRRFVRHHTVPGAQVRRR
ncbi:FAD-dependent oxidoreductase [Parasphingorhabdus sp.]|uniref:FAD-dependent oxidoreductase n=1 Tax=Parasphingorhabdus sp. TaxID=2709688 RepID=UPI003593FE0E